MYDEQNLAQKMYPQKSKGSKGRRNAQDMVRHNAETIAQTSGQAVADPHRPTPGSHDSSGDPRAPSDPRRRRRRTDAEHAAALYGDTK